MNINKEYESLRQEILLLQKMRLTVVAFTIAATVGILGWASQHNADVSWGHMSVLLLIILIPSAISVHMFSLGSCKISSYLSVFLEGDTDKPNWETRSAKFSRLAPLTYWRFGRTLALVYLSLGVIDIAYPLCAMKRSGSSSFPVGVTILAIILSAVVILMFFYSTPWEQCIGTWRRIALGTDHQRARGLVFDIGDTLVDCHRLGEEALAQGTRVLVEQGYLSAADSKCFKHKYRKIDSSLHEPHMNHLFGDQRILDQVWAEMSIDQPLRASELFLQERARTVLSRVKKSKKLIRRLRALKKRGIRIGVVSDGTVREQRATLTALGLLDKTAPILDAVVISEDIGVEKPDERIFQKVSEVLDLHPSEVWIVGDDIERDIKSSKKAGMKTAWYHSLNTHSECVGECDILLQSSIDLYYFLEDFGVCRPLKSKKNVLIET